MSRNLKSSERRSPPSQAVQWLLKGDPSIRWQVLRDLIGSSQTIWNHERRRVAQEGWGARLLRRQNRSGMWSGGVYTPKWTSTTYTLLLLRRLGLQPGHSEALKSCRILMERGLFKDGGINFSSSLDHSETCITGFVLSLVSYFHLKCPETEVILDYILGEQMPDGGWNCQRYRGATHSSFHTTINVLEGLREYALCEQSRQTEVLSAETKAREFFLQHCLYRSHRTGEIVNTAFMRFSFPPRWHHDVLRTLDYFQASNAPYDERLEDPIALLVRKRGSDGRWNLQNRHAGRAFFEMERVGEPSRWNTLRALRVMNWWQSVSQKAA